jgi:hypothetical protein
MDSSESGNTIVEAKNLYTQQLCELLSPYLYEGMKSLFDTCKENNNQKVLKTFQEKLCSVSKWNQTIIDKEHERIVSDSDCVWLSKLIDAVFISHVKVLSSITMKDNSSINLKIPETKNFIHKCYIECARYFYVDPSLIDDREITLHYTDIQRNIKRSILAISNCIEKTIRDLIPIQEILESYLNENDNEVDNNVDDNKPQFQQETVEPIHVDNDIDNDIDNDNDNGHDNYNDNGDGDDSVSVKEEDNMFMSNPNVEQRSIPDLRVASGNTVAETTVHDNVYKRDEHDDYRTNVEENKDHSEIKNIVIPGQTRNQIPSNGDGDDDPFFSDDEDN